jgi:formylglycine-generating enzyme required for sulfatase activity
MCYSMRTADHTRENAAMNPDRRESIVARIFLSYRRDDSGGHAGRLYDRLCQHFGRDNLFMDVDTIALGLDFVEAIQDAVGACDVLLAVIGRQWLTSTDPLGHRRLDNPEDFVRLEIITALTRNIRVIPVLVGGASMPRSTELPDVLQPLARRQALVVGEHFHPDVDRLITTLETVFGVASSFTNSLGMDFVLIPAGAFPMGSTDRLEEERPIHEVQISKPFYLSRYPVTQAQWEAMRGGNPSYFQGDGNLPVDSVSWNDVREFIRLLKREEGGSAYRLPTEAEWEYACRAGSADTYCFGNNVHQLGEYAWYEENAGGQSHPVGQRKPNVWGLYDMHGNVYEWVHDWYETTYYQRSPARDPSGPSWGSDRVNRGGCWGHDAWACRSARRGRLTPDARASDTGFRLARTAW